MKTLLAVAFAAITLASCAEDKTADTTTTTTDATTTEMAPPVATTTTTTTRTPAEGDVIYTGGRVQVYRTNAWADADNDVKMGNDVVIYRDGRAMRGRTQVVLEDGYVVDRDGNVWDRTGNAVSDAWDATKHGVKEAGKAIGNAAEKVGEKAKDAVD